MDANGLLMGEMKWSNNSTVHHKMFAIVDRTNMRILPDVEYRGCNHRQRPGTRTYFAGGDQRHSAVVELQLAAPAGPC